MRLLNSILCAVSVDLRHLRATLGELSLGFLLALLAALLCIVPGGQTHAQSSSRSFQMALWNAHKSNDDTDIPTFYDNEPQPAGRSIMVRFQSNGPVSGKGYLDQNQAFNYYDWSRIVAVLVDEPYMSVFDNLETEQNEEDSAPYPCANQTSLNLAHTVESNLATRAGELRDIAPLTRFWVNFTDREISWIMDAACTNPSNPLTHGLNPLNKPYIDVISFDRYWEDFDTSIKQKYEWLADHPAKPDQQLALIPGTFHRVDSVHSNLNDSPSTMAGYLEDFYKYADEKNESCNLDRGSRGRTSSFDGCRVWIVLGWLAENFPANDHLLFVGERDARSEPIRTNWRNQRALPIRADLALQREKRFLSTILPAFAD